MKEIWMQGNATVLGCHNDSPVLSALTFGTRPIKKYRVAFSFVAESQTYQGDFLSAKAFAEGDSLPVRYSSGDPNQNNLTHQAPPAKTSWMTIIIALLFLAAVARFLVAHYSH